MTKERYRYISAHLGAPFTHIAELPLYDVEYQRLLNAAGTFRAKLKMPDITLGESITQVIQEEFIDQDAGLVLDAGSGDPLNGSGFGGSALLTWQASDLQHLTRQIMTLDGGNLPADPAIDGDIGSFLNSAGAAGGSSRRDFYLHGDTDGWTDVRVKCDAIDPLLFMNNHPTLGNVLPQGGACLRTGLQEDGRYRGITINNNIAFFVGFLNIGVWHCWPDGTGFQNRQASWPIGDMLPFPYGFEAELHGNIIYVRIFEDPNDVPDWDDPTHARVINLDTEAGDAMTIPTPTGPGISGVTVAHQGTDPLSAVRLHRMEFTQLDQPPVSNPVTNMTMAGATTPHDNAYNVTDEFWIEGAANPTTLSSPMCILSKWVTPDEKSFRLNLLSDGHMAISWSTDGVDEIHAISENPVFTNTNIWRRFAVHVQTDVGGGSEIQFYVTDYDVGIETVPFSSWDQVGSTLSGPITGDVNISTSPLEVGRSNTGLSDQFYGRIAYICFKNGDHTGTVLASPQFRYQESMG